MIRTLRMPAALVASLCLTSIPLLAQHGGGHASGRASGRSASRASVSHAAPRIAVSRAPVHTTFGQPRVVYAQSRGTYGHVTGGSRGTAVVRGGYGGVYGGRYYGGRSVYVAPIRYYSPYYAFRPRFSIGFGIWLGYPVAFSSSFYYGYPYYYAPYYAPPYPYYGYSYPYPYGYPPAPAYGYPPPYTSMNTYPSNGYPTQGYPAQNYPAQGPPAQSYPAQSYPAQGAYPEPTASQPQSQPQQSAAIAEPGTPAGGISFDINPSTAAVIIDGTYVGRVADLGPTTQPMGLKPGHHRVEIRAAGYETVTFDADIVAGQVLPYKGDMQPIR